MRLAFFFVQHTLLSSSKTPRVLKQYETPEVVSRKLDAYQPGCEAEQSVPAGCQSSLSSPTRSASAFSTEPAACVTWIISVRALRQGGGDG